MGAAVLGELLLLALGCLLAALYLRRRPAAGLFEPLAVAAMPLATAAALSFAFLQRPSPQLDRIRTAQAQQMDAMARSFFPEAGQAAQREEFLKTSRFIQGLTPVFPALELMVHLSLLAAFTVFLRRRLVRQGRAQAPEPLSRWTAPYGLAWLVLGPAAWLLASKHGLAPGPAWSKWLAWNLEVVGLGIFLFQGLVVAGAKLATWSREPATRFLAVLALGGAALMALSRDARPLVTGVLLLGLFEPWMDFRSLARKPPKGPAAP